jgi:HPt (histidine-containing phosphotransfer) domain-containing protein
MTKKNISQVLDLEYLKSIIDEDKEFEQELFKIFIENSQRNITKLEESIESNDKNSWYMASHAFKGASASIGAFELAKILEYAQRNIEDSNENKKQLLDKIKEELELVKEFLKSGI